MSNKFSALSKAMKGEVLPEQEEVDSVKTIPEIIEAPKRNRAKGKRSNPDYEQVGVYIPKKISLETKRQLLESDMDFSDLVTQLLGQWLKENG
jgi:hypothetical protein